MFCAKSHCSPRYVLLYILPPVPSVAINFYIFRTAQGHMDDEINTLKDAQAAFRKEVSFQQQLVMETAFLSFKLKIMFI